MADRGRPARRAGEGPHRRRRAGRRGPRARPPHRPRMGRHAARAVRRGRARRSRDAAGARGVRARARRLGLGRAAGRRRRDAVALAVRCSSTRSPAGSRRSAGSPTSARSPPSAAARPGSPAATARSGSPGVWERFSADGLDVPAGGVLLVDDQVDSRWTLTVAARDAPQARARPRCCRSCSRCAAERSPPVRASDRGSGQERSGERRSGEPSVGLPGAGRRLGRRGDCTLVTGRPRRRRALRRPASVGAELLRHERQHVVGRDELVVLVLSTASQRTSPYSSVSRGVICFAVSSTRIVSPGDTGVMNRRFSRPELASTGPGRRIDEEPRRPRDEQVAVRDPAGEERVRGGRLLVHVRVERVARERARTSRCPRASPCATPTRPGRRCAARRATCGTGARRRAATPRPRATRPVSAVSISGEPCTAVRCMWCSTARMPPSSSPPPARPGPPCTRFGSGEPWPVEERASSRSRNSTRPLYAAMPRRERDGDRGVVRRDARHERAAAARHERGRLVERVVADDRRDRPERLDLVQRRARGIREPQQHRRDEGAVGCRAGRRRRRA